MQVNTEVSEDSNWSQYDVIVILLFKANNEIYKCLTWLNGKIDRRWNSCDIVMLHIGLIIIGYARISVSIKICFCFCRILDAFNRLNIMQLLINVSHWWQINVSKIPHISVKSCEIVKNCGLVMLHTFRVGFIIFFKYTLVYYCDKLILRCAVSHLLYSSKFHEEKITTRCTIKNFSQATKRYQNRFCISSKAWETVNLVFLLVTIRIFRMHSRCHFCV